MPDIDIRVAPPQQKTPQQKPPDPITPDQTPPPATCPAAEQVKADLLKLAEEQKKSADDMARLTEQFKEWAARPPAQPTPGDQGPAGDRGPIGPPGPQGPPGNDGQVGAADIDAVVIALKADPDIQKLIAASTKPIDYQEIAKQVLPHLPPIAFQRTAPDGTVLGVEWVHLGEGLTFRMFPHKQ